MAPSRHTARDARAPGWFWSDNDLIDHYGPLIGAYGIAVYCALARYADRDGRAFPSYNKLAKQLRISRTKVITTIADLEQHGLIEIDQRLDERGDPASNIYTLTAIAQQSHETARGSTPHALPSTPHALPSTPDALQVVHQVYGGSTPHVSEEDSMNKTHMEPPPPPAENNERAVGGGGGGRVESGPTETQRALLAFGFSARSAARFRDLPLDAVQVELRAAKQRGSGPGALVEAWKVEPPGSAPPKARQTPLPEPPRIDRPPDVLTPQQAAQTLTRLRALQKEVAHDP